MLTSRKAAIATKARSALIYLMKPSSLDDRMDPLDRLDEKKLLTRARAIATDMTQGTLSILIRDPPAGQTNGVSEQEVYQRFAQFGEIKSVYPSDKRPDVKFIEFYDSRVSFGFPFPLVLLVMGTDRILKRLL